MALTKVIGRGLGVQGDTVAGDDAALGFTSTEGLILTGQGSTGDVTIKNDADALVAFVPTGTDDLRMPDNAQLQIGNDADLKIYHGTNTYFEGGTNSGKMRFYTAGNLALDIDTAGAITKPLQPAFLARPSGTISNVALNTGQVVTFGTEIFDQNADFSSNTFTAPVTGRYLLNFSLYVVSLDSAVNFYEAYLQTSNRIYYCTIDPDYGQDNTYFTFNLTVLADMDANDTADVKFYQSAGTQQTDIGSSSHFAGHLAC